MPVDAVSLLVTDDGRGGEVADMVTSLKKRGVNIEQVAVTH
jgi:hypothetical protein